VIVPNGRAGRAAAFRGALVFVVLLNSVAVAYGFRQLHDLAAAYNWIAAPALAELAGYYARADPTRQAGVVVDVYHSFSCAACRSSAPAVDSARTQFGDSVIWRVHFISRGPVRDPVGFRAATLAVCLGEHGGQKLFTSLTSSFPLTDGELAAAVRGLDVPANVVVECASSPTATQEVWRASFRATAMGVVATPKISVNGITVSGQVRAEALSDLIESALARHPRYARVSASE
jgi:hypothetical protein